MSPSGRIGLRIFSKFGLFEWKQVTWKQIGSLAACYALCTPLSNLSLAFNSVGFYQMLKILTTPYVAFVEATFYGAKFSTPIKASLGLVTIGVMLASVNDVEVRRGFPTAATTRVPLRYSFLARRGTPAAGCALVLALEGPTAGVGVFPP